VHEIARGTGIRSKAFGRREAWCAVCTTCNTHDLCGYELWPLARQLAVKLVTDPAWFNLQVFNVEIRGRAPDAITLEDIAPYLDWRRTG